MSHEFVLAVANKSIYTSVILDFSSIIFVFYIFSLLSFPCVDHNKEYEMFTSHKVLFTTTTLNLSLQALTNLQTRYMYNNPRCVVEFCEENT